MEENVVHNPAIIVLASRIGGGKSTLAHALSKLSGFPIFSFGQYVKETALTRNIALSREALQNLGEHLVTDDPESFTKGALSGVDFSAGLIIDGLRHQTVLEQIRSLAEQVPVVLVFVQTARHVRIDRLLARGMSVKEIERADKHIMERFLEETLLAAANVVVNGVSSLDSNAEIILGRVVNSPDTI
jgi:dephospho-CoA kinase